MGWFFSVDKSDHTTEGSPPTFHLARFGGTARETVHPLPARDGERSGGGRGESPATSSPSSLLRRRFKLHPPQDPAQGQAYSQRVLWLDQRPGAAVTFGKWLFIGFVI